MSQLVLLGEQPSALELAGLLERLTSATGLTELAKEGKLSALLDAGVFKQQSTILGSSDDELSSVLALAFAVLAQLTVPAETSAATNKFAALLTTDPTQRTQFKIRTLTNLINVVGALPTIAPSQRFQLLLQLLDFSAAASTGAQGQQPAQLVLQPLTTLASLVDFWKLSPEQALALYSSSYKLSNVAPPKKQSHEVYNLGQQPTVQQEYLFALLKAIDAAGAVNPAVLKEKAHQDLAVQAVLASVSNGLASTFHQLDPTHVFPLAVVQSLASSNSAPSAAAFALLKAVVDGDLPGYQSFEKTHAAFLKEHAAQLDPPTLLRKMRTLALCQVAVQNQTTVLGSGADNVLSYKQIRDSLKLPANEDVEGLVIDAVMAGRIDAKMDQEAETLCVKRVTGGVPLSLYSGPSSDAAWSALGSRLRTWKANIHNVLTTLNLSHQIDAQDAGEDIQ